MCSLRLPFPNGNAPTNVEEPGMTLTDLERPTYERPAYEPPALEVLGSLTSLAEGAGPDRSLIVMQTGFPQPGMD